jgi:HlyD family secretion protein
VVTYATVIDVPNDELKLKPGMTANVNIEIARAANALRVPNSALRFRPSNDAFAALGQTPPPTGPRGQGAGGANGEGGTGRGGSAAPPAGGTAQPAPSSPSPTPSTPPSPTSGEGSSSSAGRRSSDSANANGEGSDPAARSGSARQMQTLSPEQRDAKLARMRGRGAAAGAGSAPAANVAGRGRQSGAPAAAPTATGRNGGATTIDALFGPLPRAQSVGRVWRYINNQLKPVRVRLGISDGQATELLDGDLHEGDPVVTNVTTATETTRPAAGAGFPFGQPQRGFGGQGGFQGGGNRGGGAGGGATRGGGR